jgi:hypothetical protein
MSVFINTLPDFHLHEKRIMNMFVHSVNVYITKQNISVINPVN